MDTKSNKYVIGTDLTRDLHYYKLDSKFSDLSHFMGHELVYIDPDKPNKDELSKVDIYIGDRVHKVFQFLHNVKWIHLTSVGTDSITTLDTTRVVVTNSADMDIENSVVEMTMAYLLNVTKSVHGLYKMENVDRKSFEPFCKDIMLLRECNILIVGNGKIGSKLTDILTVFGANVMTVDSKNSHRLLELAAGRHIIINALPLVKETYKIFNSNFFFKCDQFPIFINIGRGKTVNEEDLIRAMKSNVFKYVILDVFDTEPLPSNSELLKFDNVLLSPHIGSYHNSYWAKQFSLFQYNLARFTHNEKMLNVVE